MSEIHAPCGCCGPIPFEWAKEHGYVNTKMTRAMAQERIDRWKADKPELRPATTIDDKGNLIGPDGILVNGWRATYISHLMEDNMVSVKGGPNGPCDHYKRV